jgi:dTDP-glucose 4,6-dehydratase
VAHLLVIGGSGFFGKSILDSYQRGLLARFDVTSITVMARRADKLLIDAPHLLSNSVSLLNSNISNCTSLPSADIIIHAAASSDERNYISRPQEERVNIQAGTSNFCKLVPLFCKNAQIVYVSSGAAYGYQSQNIVQVTEDSPLGSIEQLAPQKRDYAVAKRDGEKVILELGQQGCHVSIARCFAFVGSYLPLNQHFAIGNFIRDGMQGEAIKVNAKGDVYRSYLYADDLVQWLLRIGQAASPACPIFNVGSDEAISIQDLAKKIATYFQVGLQLPQINNTSVDRYIPSIEKARSIGCQINYPLDMAIEATVNSLLKSQSS